MFDVSTMDAAEKFSNLAARYSLMRILTYSVKGRGANYTPFLPHKKKDLQPKAISP